MVSADGLSSTNQLGVIVPLEVWAEDHHDGYGIIFREPVAGRNYVVGADVAEGLGEKIQRDTDEHDSQEHDYSCGHVLDYETMEQVAIWHGRLAPDLFARDLYKMGALYNWAYMAVEFNGPGETVLNKLHKDFLYPNLYIRQNLTNLDESVSPKRPGFITSSRTKPVIINSLLRLVREREITLWDKPTIDELLAFQHNRNKSGQSAYSAPPGEYDDRVMALAIACEAHRQYVPPAPQDPDREFYEMAKHANVGITPRRKGDLRHRDKPKFSQREWCRS